MNDPHLLRQKVLAHRDQLTAGEQAARSRAIRAALLALGEVKAAASICIYVSFRSEVQTLEIIGALLDLGAEVSVPVTRVQQKRLDVIRITDPDRDLVPGYCSILEPRQELRQQRLVDPARLDLVILPGSVFDLRGGRFGYGGGYYDRLLAGIPAAGRIGLAFELQVVDRLPLEEHDQLLDQVITEERLITGSRPRP